MNTAQLIVGPQMVGIILMIVGFVMFRFPPKKINNYYGYRMPSAMKNQQTWDVANRYSAIYMMKAGLVVTIIGAAIAALFAGGIIGGKLYPLIGIGSMLFSGIIPAVCVIVATEKHLTKTFNN